MLTLVSKTQYYCLGNGSKKECKTCQHEKAWNELNELTDVERIPKQSAMLRISDERCMLGPVSLYKPV